MTADPAYAYRLAETSTDFDAAQTIAHRAANVVWPRALGTTPWGVTATLNVHSGAFGVRYGWRPLNRARSDDTRRAMAAAIRSASDGWPVPLLIGRWEPRHWVLVVDGTPETLRCYEPSGGEVVDIAVDDVAEGRADPLGFPYPHAVVLPVSSVDG
jgi:hypothetical protein